MKTRDCGSQVRSHRRRQSVPVSAATPCNKPFRVLLKPTCRTWRDGLSPRRCATTYGHLVGVESSFEGHESAEDLAGIPGDDKAHDLATLAAVVYGEKVGEYVNKHDEWLAATKDWTFDEIRNVLCEEASDSALMGIGLMPVAGWCRCGDHSDLIESFLSDYRLRYDEEGWVIDLFEKEGEEDDS